MLRLYGQTISYNIFAYFPDRQLQLTDYKVWNTIGDAPITSRPPRALVDAIAVVS